MINGTLLTTMTGRRRSSDLDKGLQVGQRDPDRHVLAWECARRVGQVNMFYISSFVAKDDMTPKSWQRLRDSIEMVM